LNMVFHNIIETMLSGEILYDDQVPFQ